MIETGIVFGRFQPLHLKQTEYLLAAKMRCRKLYIGITVPDRTELDDESDEKRLKKSANPATYQERLEMICGTLMDFGVPRTEFEIVPFPIDRPDLLKEFIPKDGIAFISVCDEESRKVKKVLEDLEFKTEVLWTREDEEKGTTGTIVRQRILAGEKWNDLVPKYVAEYAAKSGLADRIRE